MQGLQRLFAERARGFACAQVLQEGLGGAPVERAAGPKVEERKRIEAGIAAALGDAKLAGLTREAAESMAARQIERLWKHA